MIGRAKVCIQQAKLRRAGASARRRSFSSLCLSLVRFHCPGPPTKDSPGHATRKRREKWGPHETKTSPWPIKRESLSQRVEVVKNQSFAFGPNELRSIGAPVPLACSSVDPPSQRRHRSSSSSIEYWRGRARDEKSSPSQVTVARLGLARASERSPRCCYCFMPTLEWTWAFASAATRSDDGLTNVGGYRERITLGRACVASP